MIRRTTTTLALVAPLALLLAVTGCPRTTDTGNDGGNDTQTDGGGDTSGNEGADYAGTCSDGIDNDADGFTDCDDFACTGSTECETSETTTIQDIQDESSSNHPTGGSTVTVAGAVVTAVKVGGGNVVAFWMQQGTGPYSGVYVFCASACMEQVSVGDTVTVTAEYSEYPADSTTGTLTELGYPSNITISGQGTVPAPQTMSPSEFLADAEPWEGVLIELKAASGNMTVGTDGKSVDGIGFYKSAGYNWVPAAGDEVQSLVGVVDYYSVDDQYQILPRTAEDVTLGDGSHPDGASGNEGGDYAGTCTDGIDNDGDGYTDCDDYGCDTDPACAVAAVTVSISSIQDETAADHPATGTPVTVEGAMVTAVKESSGSQVGFWIQQGSGQYSGIYAYCGNSGCPTAVQVGDDVDVSGEYGEYHGASQVGYVDAITVNSSGGTPATATVSPTDFLASSEPWEGVLVELKAASGDMTTAVTTDANGNTDVTVDDVTIYGIGYIWSATDGDQVSSIVGVVDSYDDAFEVRPRQAEDITLSGGGHPSP